MKNHYNILVQNFCIPLDAKTYLINSKEKIFNEYNEEIKQIIAKFYKVKNKTFLIENEVKSLSEKSNIHEYTLYFIVLACSSYYMLEDFKRANISEKVFWDTIEDLQYKLIECKNVKGVWGNFAHGWYNIFYTLDIFKLGRLEFERVKFPKESYTFEDVTVNKGDTVYSVHIPSCGALSKELREISYKKAFDFFKDELCDKPLVCICDSWLLYPQNREIFPKNSNLLDFLSDWDIIESNEDPNFGNAWRVFNKDYQKGQMNAETSLQKAIVNYIENGGTMGSGFGIKIIKP
ncbi:MAG: acyltransferase domain-containing protein [Clostridia bacterium]